MNKNKEYIIKILFEHGCLTKDNSLYFSDAQKKAQDEQNIQLSQFETYIGELRREGYISNEGLNKDMGGWRCLPLTEKGREKGIYLKKNIIYRRFIDLSELYNKISGGIKILIRFFGIIIFVLSILFYLRYGVRIEDTKGFIDSLKNGESQKETLIQK